MFLSEAIFAADLFGATPMEQVRPLLCLTAALTSRASDFASSSVLDLLETSRKSSSMLACSN